MRDKPPKIPPLARSVASGFSMMTIQAVAARIAALVGQVLLAWYLGPEEFGLMALALTVQVFVGVLQQAGLKEVLVQRQSSFHRLASTTFWLSAIIGLTAAMVMVCVAPVVASAYGAGAPSEANAIDRRVLVPMLWVLALAMPISSIGTVAMARLQIEMRFNVISMLALIQSVGTVALSCTLAALGFGVMSFVIPWPVIALINTSIAWYKAAPGITIRPTLRLWRKVLQSSTKLLLASAFIQCTTQGGAIVLGLLHNDNATVGIFSFAFSFALQTTQLLTHNLSNVIFPALARLGAEPRRQSEAFFRAAKLLATIGAPICILQAAVTPALLDLFFHGKWAAAALPMQILSVAMAWQLANGPALQFLIALKRNSLVLGLAILFAAIFLSLVTIGGLLGGATAVAISVAIYNVIVGQICVLAPARITTYPIRTAAKTYIGPFALSALSALCAVGLWRAQRLASSSAAELLFTSGMMLIVYVLLLRGLTPSSYNHLREIATNLMRRKSAS